MGYSGAVLDSVVLDQFQVGRQLGHGVMDQHPIGVPREQIALVVRK